MNPFLASLLSTLAPEGLTAEHIALLQEDGLNSPSRVLRLSATDLKTLLKINLGLASDILSAAEAAKSSDFGTSQMNETVVIRTNLENLLGAANIRTAAVQELLNRRIHFVVEDSSRVLKIADTLNLIASPDRTTAEQQGLWKEMKLVSVKSFLPDLTPLRSPYGTEKLVEGRDWRSGLMWGELPRERLGLAVWAVEQGLDAGKSQDVVFEDFKSGGEIYTRAARIAAAKDLSNKDLEQMALFGAVPTKSKAPASPKVGSQEIAQLLLVCFGGEELRRFAKNSLGFMYELPDGNASPLTVADCIVESYPQREGGFDAHFFKALINERPRRRDEIIKIASKFGVRI